MISLVSINEFFSMILPMFEFLLVFAAILFLIHLKLKADKASDNLASIAKDLRRIADKIEQDKM